VQKLLEKLNHLPIGQALKIGFLRSLMRARYAVEPLGHYGLAKKKYTHFTSPIRRYADLIVHRALFQQQGQQVADRPLKEVAEHISETERNSDDAERDSRDVKMFAFLNAQVKSADPARYPALVTDVRNFGFFVDVTGLGMSGLVPLSGVSDDFYQFDATRGQLVGRRTRRVFKLGDKVEVQVAKVDTFKKQVDFKLAGLPDGRAKRDARPERLPQRRQPEKKVRFVTPHPGRPRESAVGTGGPLTPPRGERVPKAGEGAVRGFKGRIPSGNALPKGEGDRWTGPRRGGGRQGRRGGSGPHGRAHR
jgi:ribonuclease R